MSITIPPRVNGPNGYDPSASGCTGCGSQDTTHVDGVHGRRCANCPAPFNREWADALVDMGLADVAFSYLRAWLAHRARTL